MPHPVQKAIEALYDKGACPRIQVNLTVEGVVCPDFVREQWKERLVIDLDPTYPLDLAFTEQSVQADLSFDGFVTRCVFPFDSIYAVLDRATQKGIVIEQNLPASMRHTPTSTPTAASRAASDAKAGGKWKQPGRTRRRRRPKAKPELQAAPDLGPQAPTAPEPVDGGREPQETGDEEARRRRSVFQVIDGDG